MMAWLELAILIAMPFMVVLVVILWRKTPRRLRVKRYQGDWKQLQIFCKDQTTWPKALADADKLLDQVLKRRKYSGKSMGERLVSAQRKLSDNDSIWKAHNLTKKVTDNPSLKIRETVVKSSLIAYRQALRDLGALNDK